MCIGKSSVNTGPCIFCTTMTSLNSIQPRSCRVYLVKMWRPSITFKPYSPSAVQIVYKCHGLSLLSRQSLFRGFRAMAHCLSAHVTQKSTTIPIPTTPFPQPTPATLTPTTPHHSDYPNSSSLHFRAENKTIASSLQSTPPTSSCAFKAVQDTVAEYEYEA